MNTQIKNSSIESWMLQCLDLNGNCLIGNKRVRKYGIEEIEKDFEKFGKCVIIHPVYDTGIEDASPYTKAGNKNAMNKELSFVAYLKKSKSE